MRIDSYKRLGSKSLIFDVSTTRSGLSGLVPVEREDDFATTRAPISKHHPC